MATITVRFVHHPSRAPVMEIEMPAATTIGSMKAMLIDRLASDEYCLMRLFLRWHVEIELGRRMRLVELTAADEDEPLHSLGISHLSEVHLEGPLTGDSAEGVGQALSLIWGQMQELKTLRQKRSTILWISIVRSVAVSLPALRAALLSRRSQLLIPFIIRMAVTGEVSAGLAITLVMMICL